MRAPVSTYRRHSEYDSLFRYFLDTIVSMLTIGRARIPLYVNDSNESEEVCSFLYQAVSLLEWGLLKSMFDIVLESHFYRSLKKCDSEDEIGKLVLIKNIVGFLYYEEDIPSFFDTSNMWSLEIQHYAQVHIYPVLQNSRHCGENWMKDILKWFEVDDSQCLLLTGGFSLTFPEKDSKQKYLHKRKVYYLCV